VPAKEARSGTYYRLTRDPGKSYYTICSPAQVRTLEKRVVGKDFRMMSPEDRKLAHAVKLCREQAHVLGTRWTRFIDDSGKRREMRSYVAFPPDYLLREVAKPPSYGGGKRKNKGGAEERSDTTEGETTDGDEASDASRATS
jgi:hypothetical protein